MGYKLQVSQVARANVREAVSYYKQKASVKVAQNFVQDYEEALERIKQNPFFQVYYKDFRGLPLKKYPYVIFYQVNEGKGLVRIKAVFQGNQNTQKRP